MKLVTFQNGAGMRAGMLSGESVIDVLAVDPALPHDMLSIVAQTTDDWAAALRDAPDSAHHALSELKLLAPIPSPARNIICVGKNYHEHAAEFAASGFDTSTASVVVPSAPVVFTKSPGSVSGPGDPIQASLDDDASVDYEGELAVVIGRGGRRIAPADAMEHVFGYTIINDVTARTAQRRHNQWFLGKSIDGFCPMGPMIVTRDEIPDIGACELRTFVNGELRQQALVASLIFDIPTLIATISRSMTLVPGDIIATGTPSGVGIGFSPPKFLQAGDEVVVQVDGIGELRNPVV